MRLIEFQGELPQLPEDGRFFVADDATLIGRVSLGVDASVWYGCVLRGDNEPITIGEGSNVQDLSVIHTDPGFPVTIGRNCTIGHRAIVHGCTVLDGALIGMGAIVLNGAVIGRNCLIGAGALIPENREIPDGSLVVGSPGRVIRTLDEAGQRRIATTAANYVAKSRIYAAAARGG